MQASVSELRKTTIQLFSLCETSREGAIVIRKLKSGEYRLYSKNTHPRTGKRQTLGTFSTKEAAEKHERAGQYFKRQG